MKLSVAMATYNGGRHISQQLESLATQTCRPDELVVSDDGSTDDTVDLVRKFSAVAPFPVTLDAHGRKLGVCQNFLHAIGRCSGDIVALADQDDVWLAPKLETTSRHFQKDDAIVGVCHRVKAVLDDLTPTTLVTPSIVRMRRVTATTVDPLMSVGGMQFLFRRSALMPWLQAARPQSRWWRAPAVFDEFLFFLATAVGIVVLLPDVLGLWRRHDAAVSSIGPGRSIFEATSSAYQRSLTWAAGSEQYMQLSEVAASRAMFAEMVRDGSEPPIRGRAGAAAAHYRRFENTYLRRAGLYASDHRALRRFATLTAMLWSGDYRQRERGGLGVRSLTKDSLIAIVGSRRIQRN